MASLVHNDSLRFVTNANCVELRSQNFRRAVPFFSFCYEKIFLN